VPDNEATDAPPAPGGWRQPPVAAVLTWVGSVLGTSSVEIVRGMREGGSPWLLRTAAREAVLRIGGPDDREHFDREVAAIEFASAGGVPAPAVLGHDDGEAAGMPLLLFERMAGASAIPSAPDRERLRRLGAVTASLHAIRLTPSDLLPVRERPIASVDFAALRREGHDGALQRAADDQLASLRPTDGPVVLVHGDLWQGNTVWDGPALTGVVDWDCAGVGAAGVDLGSLRCDAALTLGADAADEILTGWEQAAGGPAPDVAYWDVVAALSTPPDMGWFASAIQDQGRPDLDRPTLFARREAFLRDALGRLG
jgi:aminoglycoside phosphotransferase (APT) family kinase protein